MKQLKWSNSNEAVQMNGKKGNSSSEVQERERERETERERKRDRRLK